MTKIYAIVLLAVMMAACADDPPATDRAEEERVCQAASSADECDREGCAWTTTTDEAERTGEDATGVACRPIPLPSEQEPLDFEAEAACGNAPCHCHRKCKFKIFCKTVCSCCTR